MRTIRYLNTDLDLISAENLSSLAAQFEAAGMFTLYVGPHNEGLWSARFDIDTRHHEPQSTIGAMVDVIESLGEQHRSTWFSCTMREFNIGYDCGDEPGAFTQGLPSELLGRIAALRASLGITLYPERPNEPASSPQ